MYFLRPAHFVKDFKFTVNGAEVCSAPGRDEDNSLLHNAARPHYSTSTRTLYTTPAQQQQHRTGALLRMAKLNPLHDSSVAQLLRTLDEDRTPLQRLQTVLKDRAGEETPEEEVARLTSPGGHQLFRRSQVEIFTAMLDALAELICSLLHKQPTRLVKVDPHSYSPHGSQRPPTILERKYCYVTSLHQAVGGDFCEFILQKLRVLILDNVGGYVSSSASATELGSNTANRVRAGYGPLRGGSERYSPHAFSLRHFSTQTLAGLVRILAIPAEKECAFADQGTEFFAVYALGRWVLELIGKGGDFEKLKELEAERRVAEADRLRGGSLRAGGAFANNSRNSNNTADIALTIPIPGTTVSTRGQSPREEEHELLPPFLPLDARNPDRSTRKQLTHPAWRLVHKSATGACTLRMLAS